MKRECHSKTAVWLQEFLQKPDKHFKGFSRGFTEFHTKLDADTLLDFAINRRQNEARS
jgi:hypothetical protein